MEQTIQLFPVVPSFLKLVDLLNAALPLDLFISAAYGISYVDLRCVLTFL